MANYNKTPKFCARCGEPVSRARGYVRVVVQRRCEIVRTHERANGSKFTAPETKDAQLAPEIKFCERCGAGALEAIRAYAKGGAHD